MKRLPLCTIAIALAFTYALAGPKSIFVKNNDGFRKYSFGVASSITVTPDSKFIHLNGYDEDLKISDIEYISFDMPNVTELSPNQHKDRLIEIGEKVNSMVDANDLKDILGMCTEFDNISDYDGDVFIEKFKENHPDLYDDDEGFYAKAPAKRLINAIKAFAKGSPTAARKVTEIYTETFNADEFTGVFSANHKNEKWVKTAEADFLEIKYTGIKSGNEYCLRITPSKATNCWKEELLVLDDYVDKYGWDDEAEDMKLNITLNMPTTIEAVMTVNGKTVATAKLNSALNQSTKTIELESTVTAANKYTATCNTVLTNSGVNEQFSFSVNGKTIVTQTATVNGSDLLEIQSWIDALQAKKYEDEYEIWLEPDYKLIVGKFKNATTRADIIGELQVVGNSANFTKMQELLEDCEEEDDYYHIINNDKGTITYVYGSPKESEREASVLNNYTDASFFYDGTQQLQGFLSFETTEHLYEDGWTTDGYWDDKTDTYIHFDRPYTVYDLDYELIPILNFADGSSFAFDGEYFTGGNFNALVNDYDNIIEIVNNIISGFQID